MALISGLFWLAGGALHGEKPLGGEPALGSIQDALALQAQVKAVTARALPATVSLFSEANGSSGSGVIVSPDGLV
ncbi:MAG: hypothetical protein HKO57_15265, partial [Akkermansiaceae bacterium]|nr:hypothetical protein [Akkermansiaceae bacterium]